jgi:alginate O-acetyltransferase complex protein AlgI
MPQLTLEFVLFVGVFAALFWRLAERFRPPALAVASTCFLWAWDPISCVFLVATTAAAFAGARLARARNWIWRGGLVAIVLAFAVVKTCEVAGSGFESFAVPLGFGFYIPKLIHYWVDSDLQEPDEHGFLTFYNFMFFFPTILVGPIHRIEDFQSGERRRRWDPELLAEGLRRILYCYFKVVVVSDWAVAYLMRGYLF